MRGVQFAESKCDRVCSSSGRRNAGSCWDLRRIDRNTSHSGEDRERGRHRREKKLGDVKFPKENHQGTETPTVAGTYEELTKKKKKKKKKKNKKTPQSEEDRERGRQRRGEIKEKM